MNRPTTDLLQSHLALLYGRINYERQIRVTPREFKLQNMHGLLERLGNPHLQYHVVHVAGTKGKGSVTTMVGSILTAAGIRTGVYTSPHLETIHQRMAIDRNLITDDQLLTVLDKLLPTVTAMDQENEAAGMRKLTFFEVTTAAALLYFADQGCQAVALEVGLGGRLDSTNVCSPSVSVITNIGFDHTKILGDTLALIAGEKGGIIKPGIPVVSGVQKTEARDVIRRIAKENQSSLTELETDFQFRINQASLVTADGAQVASDLPFQPPTFETSGTVRLAERDSVQPANEVESDQGLESEKGLESEGRYSCQDLQLQLLGDHQAQNASVAIAAVQVLNQTTELEISDQHIKTGLNQARLEGRTEVLSQSPTVIVDIAHNVVSIEVMLKTLRQLPQWNSATKRRLVFAVSRDKDASGMLRQLLPEFDEMIITKYQNNPRGMETSQLTELVESIRTELDSSCELVVKADPESAWSFARQTSGDHDLVAVIGSVFLVGEIRPLILNG